MSWFQKHIVLRPRGRGFHLVTGEVLQQVPEIAQFEVGLAHFFLQHTSASLTINENADPDVPADLETSFNRVAPESAPYRHTVEGPDDMPAHVKCSLLGVGLTVPVSEGRLQLGTWQGLYLCEHRNHATARHLVVTLCGDRR